VSGDLSKKSEKVDPVRIFGKDPGNCCGVSGGCKQRFPLRIFTRNPESWTPRGFLAKIRAPVAVRGRNREKKNVAVISHGTPGHHHFKRQCRWQ